MIDVTSADPADRGPLLACDADLVQVARAAGIGLDESSQQRQFRLVRWRPAPGARTSQRR